MTVVGDVVDPDGRRVVLDDGGWEHILAEHAEVAAHRDAVLAAVTKPVVVDFSSQPAHIVTAYGNRRDPPGWTP